MAFFFSAQKRQKAKTKVQPNLLELSYTQQCKVCPLKNEKLVHPKMEPSGVKNPIIYNLGGVPEGTEDKEGIQFLGPSGEMLRKLLDDTFGRRFVKDSMRWNNCCRCKTPDNRKPTEQELQCCRKFIEEDIEKTKPLVIIGYGGIPLKWVLNVSGVEDLWRGRQIPVKIGSHIAWYFPTVHPFFVYANQRVDKQGRRQESDWDRIFKRDLERVCKFLSQKEVVYPEVIDKGYDDHILLVTGQEEGDYELVKTTLERMKSYPEIGVDIENTPLKPWESKEACWASIAIGIGDDVIAFPVEHPKAWNGKYKPILDLILDFLLNSGVKNCHNVKHELMWFYWYFGEAVLRETKWACTQRMAYVIDERSSNKRNQGMLGLGRLTLMHLGFDLKKLSNIDFNRLLEIPIPELLSYNGKDPKYTFILAQKLKAKLEGTLVNVYEHHVRNALTLAITESEGILVDSEKLQEISDKLDEEIQPMEKAMLVLPEVLKFEKQYGTTFNPGSNDDVKIVFRDILGYKKVKSSASEKASSFSVDKVVLDFYVENHQSKLASCLLEYRELLKLKSTYVTNIPALLSPIDGKLHPQFNDTLTATGRFSSEDPNMQNFPAKKNKYIRGIVICSPSDWFLAADYGQIEARVICMFSKDKRYIEAIFNDYDVHMHWAKRVIERYPKVLNVSCLEEVSKDALKGYRSLIKNKLVFPWFYLSSWKSVARALGLPPEIAEELYNEFWEYFKQVRVWQQSVIDFYNKYGYVEMLTGRRRREILSYTKLANTPVQGTASDIVTDAGNRLSALGYKQKTPQTTFRLNVHDDLSYYLPAKHLDRDVETIAREMTRPCFDFINVPLTAELKIGRNWEKLEKLHDFDSRDFEFMGGWKK